MNANASILTEAARWVGSPYVHEGVTLAGCDCTGLLSGVARALGILGDFGVPRYPRAWWRTQPSLLHDNVERAVSAVREPFAVVRFPNPIAPGDFVTLVPGGGYEYPLHAAFVHSIVGGGMNILHAMNDGRNEVRVTMKPADWTIFRSYRVVENR